MPHGSQFSRTQACLSFLCLSLLWSVSSFASTTGPQFKEGQTLTLSLSSSPSGGPQGRHSSTSPDLSPMGHKTHQHWLLHGAFSSECSDPSSKLPGEKWEILASTLQECSRTQLTSMEAHFIAIPNEPILTSLTLFSGACWPQYRKQGPQKPHTNLQLLGNPATALTHSRGPWF